MFGKVLNQYFETKDHGNVTYCLVIQNHEEKDGSPLLNQSTKIISPDQFEILELKGISTPMDPCYLT